ncbi:hypothetical protein L1049_010565 [Liquidambar formosana]|uniref:non-specific serine/threonine protein kinase n=1 Tax=Liquidambar formosana TaxID=63359 RepID=A0AAP0R4E8_LIQFO
MDKIWFLSSILVFLVHCFIACLAITPTNFTTDQSALLSFKAHIFDPYNVLTHNWSSVTSCCNWIGVTCGARHQRVVALNLSSRALGGTIPSHLGNLSFLTLLEIQNNSFHGHLPNELGFLRKLKGIDLGDNSLSGEVPLWFGTLPKLQGLLLHNNNFSGFLPEEMCNRLPELKFLSLDENQFYGQIPSSIYKCRQLQYLSLSSNKFRGSIPREIGNLTLLEELYLGDNNLRGAIPLEMGQLGHLQVLSLGLNNLTGPIPSEIFNISTIEDLNLWGNKLSGVIPSSISNASKLTQLALSRNSFTGFIPNTLGNLRLLERLFISDNFLTTEYSSTLGLGFLITSLTNCKYLRFLVLSSNPLGGILPISIGNLSASRQYLYANNCKIKGIIPGEIGNLSNLITLNLEGNELTGSIPTTVQRLQNLQGLYLENNSLQGSIPYELCHLRSLVVLVLYNNKLYRSIPACVSNLTSLRILSLGSNKLTSIIPSTLWSLADLLFLNLSTNSLSGYLPLDVGNLKVAVVIDLSWNQLSGNIPSIIGGIQSLKYLSLANNRLQGAISQSFGNLKSLEFLDLSTNNLSSVIPKSLEKLSYLKYLNVSSNRLEGEIPNDGPFVNFSAQSFVMNEALCGAPRLQVPPCKTISVKRSTILLLFKYIFLVIASIVLVLALIFVSIRCRKRNVRDLIQTDLSPLALRRISYQELVQATYGFSESSLLGTGSFGSVYKGILSDGMNVAIKVFNLQLEGAFKSFEVECEVLRSIRHRNLIKIISSCTNVHFKALILEYMPNGSLDKWLYSHNYCLDILQRLNVIIDVASALEYLHHGYSKPVIHCDLKPNNVLLDEDMVAHVGDFGIAKLLDEEETMTHTKTLATVGYMAPEYGSEGVVSTKGDVYSYGILLMETFTRKKSTDEMFVEEMSLKRWVEESLPHAVIEVADANLLRRDEEHFATKKDCISSVLDLALDCSAELPKDRIDIKEVLATLNKIRSNFQKNIART